MQQQKLCLKWNNHTVNLLSVLGSFQQQDILVDVTLSCEGRNIKAHKMVLSACSPYFQSIFLENPCQHPIVIINGMKFEDITAILNFMYKGEVNVSHDGLSSFLQAAEALKVKGLAEVCGEKKSTNVDSRDIEQDEPMRPQRTDTPNKKRHRNRKRSLSDSNRSDDEATARKHNSPEIHELSGDESFTGDMSSNGPPLNSLPRVPQNVFSRSHQSSSNLAEEGDDEYEVEPSKLLEQTLTTENVQMSNSGSSDQSLRIERIMSNATEMESSSMQEPESPPDIKPIIEYGDSNAGSSEGMGRIFNDQSQPGPSNFQESSHLHDNSQAPGSKKENAINNSNVIGAYVCESDELFDQLKANPVYVSILNTTNLAQVLTEREKTTHDRESLKCLHNSKELLIYEEEGCMRGIELNKNIISDDSSVDMSICSVHDSNVITYSASEEKKNSQDRQHFTKLSENFNKKPENLKKAHEYNYGANKAKTSCEMSNETSHLSPHVVRLKNNVDENVTINQSKRKRRQPCKRGRKSVKESSDFAGKNQQIMPYSVLQEQSNSQIMARNIHMPGESISRPRRSIKVKTASEMLKLKKRIKRKIVQSTIEIESYEGYDSDNIPEMQIQKFSPKKTQKAMSTKRKNRFAIMSSFPMLPKGERDKYGPKILPPMWNVSVMTRKAGKSAGNIDIYFITPDGKKLRSKSDVAKYIEQNGLLFHPDEFNFKKSAYKSWKAS